MDIVIIAFERDLPLLEVQSRSIAKFCKLDIERIIIVNNYSHKRFQNDLLDYRSQLDYGPHDHKVEIIDKLELSDFVMENARARKISIGYMMQMVYKLLIARHVTATEYMILDCKTYFIRDITNEDVYRDGRVRATIANVWKPDFWYPSFVTALDEFNVNKPENNHVYVLNQTPYFIHTQIVRDMLDHLDAKHVDFVRWFDSRIIDGDSGHINEFFLIQAYVLMKYDRLDDVFWTANQRMQRQMWDWETAKIVTTIEDYLSDYHGEPTDYFAHGIQRLVWEKMNADQREEMPVWWERLGIIPASRGRNIINDVIRLNSDPWPNNLPADQIVNSLKKLTADDTTTTV